MNQRMNRHNRLMLTWVFSAVFLILCLMRPGYYFYHFCAFILMMIYGLIMHLNRSRSALAGPDRPTPWILLALMSCALFSGPCQTFEVPLYSETPPLKKLGDVPVTVADLAPGMSRSEVLKLKGEPTSEDLSHFLMPLKLDAKETSETLASLTERDPSVPEFNELLEWQKKLGEPPGFEDERRQSMVRRVRESFLERETPKIVFTDELLDTEDYKTLLSLLEPAEAGHQSYLFLQRNLEAEVMGLLLSDTARPIWFYENEKLTLTFKSQEPDVLEVVSGRQLKLGTRPLAEIGQLLDKMKPLGGPLEKDRQELFKYSAPDQLQYRKRVFGEDVFLTVKDGVIEGLQLGL